MALSGSKTVTVTAYDKLIFSWSATQSVSGNYSTVSWKMQLKSTTYGAISSSASKDWSVTVNGTKKSGTNTVSIGANATKTLASGSVRVNHNSDGTKSFSFSFSQEFAINFNGWVGTKSGSGSATLNTIPRASSLTVPTISLGHSGTLSISRASSSFTHTVSAKFGSYSQTIASKTSSTSLTFSPPLSWGAAIPNSTSGTCIYTIQTYNGSTLIGTKTVSGKLQITSADAAPTGNSVTVSDASVYGSGSVADHFDGDFVQTKMIPKGVVSASGRYGATIKSTFMTVEGTKYTGNATTVKASKAISGSGSITVNVGVVDSRGFTNSWNRTLTIVPYAAPTLTTFTAFRCDESGEAIDDGDRLNCQRVYKISPINNKNTNQWKIEARKSGDSTWTGIANGTGYNVSDNYITTNFFDVDYPYQVQFTITDSFTTVSKIIEIPTAFTLVDYHGTGKGIAFGKVATDENLFDVNLPAIFRNRVDHTTAVFDMFGTRINNGLANYGGSGTSAIDPDTTKDELILTNKNTPQNALFYIRTMFYSSKKTSRFQIAFPYATPNAPIYYRYYYFEDSKFADWKMLGGGYKILWQGAYYMSSGQSVKLPEKVSQQSCGIVLRWEMYVSGAVKSSDYNYVFVPKWHIYDHNGGGVAHLCTTSVGGTVGTKYVYVSDTAVTGFNGNSTGATTTASGIKTTNSSWVLSAIIGV